MMVKHCFCVWGYLIWASIHAAWEGLFMYFSFGGEVPTVWALLHLVTDGPGTITDNVDNNFDHFAFHCSLGVEKVMSLFLNDYFGAQKWSTNASWGPSSRSTCPLIIILPGWFL